MSKRRVIKDAVARYVMFGLAFMVALLIFVMAYGLIARSAPLLKLKPISELLLSVNWRPSAGHFGFAPFILGTIWVTATAMLLAVPSAILTAIYLSEYAHKRARDIFKPALDVASGISPVIFGLFGVVVVVPFVKTLSPDSTGFSILSAGIVLAMMVFPTIASVAEEVIHSIPREARESSLSLGATGWETIKCVLLRKAGPGIVAAIILGLSRAFGETIAVLMVVGNVVQVPRSLFDAAYTLPALIANNYGEMLSVPLYDSALLFAALILLVVTVFFNIAAWTILLRIERSYV